MSSVLLKKFFPPLLPINQAESNPNTYAQLPLEPLSMDKVKQAVCRAKLGKALGPDGMPAEVWQEVWLVVKDTVLQLFQTSLLQGKLPSQWKVTRIIPLWKPDKPNYSSLATYRPISLLPTLSKAMETIVADQILYLAETHNLLPANHFGAWKGRSITQALLTLQERIWDV